MPERSAQPNAKFERKRDLLELIEFSLIVVARAMSILLGAALIILATVVLF
jgi:hypothetical protein